MMKIRNKYISSLVAGVMFVGTFSSCDNKEQYLYSGPKVDSYPDVTVASPSPAIPPVFEEPAAGETLEVTFDLSLSKPYISKINVYSEEMEGTTATAGEDYDATNYLFNALTKAPEIDTTGLITLTIYGDTEIEEDEVVKLQIGTDRSANVGTMNGQTVEFTLKNWESPEFESYTSWFFADGSEDFNGESPEELLDLAILLYKLTEEDPTFVTGVLTGAYEHLTIPEGLEDGDYLLVADQYFMFDPGSFGEQSFNIVQTFEQFGKTEMYELPVSAMPSTADEPRIYNLAIIRITDGEYTTITIEDYLSRIDGSEEIIETVHELVKSQRLTRAEK